MFQIMTAQKCLKLLKVLLRQTVRLYATEVKFPVGPFRLHNLDQGPPTEVILTKTDALRYYEIMTTIRKMEATINGLYKARLVHGFCHLYSGQEAVCTGVHAVLRPQDSTITSYRNHPWTYLAHDLNPDCVIAELVGQQSGCVRGKGGSMHMYGTNMFGGNAIVGAQVPLGVGIALSYKYRNVDSVCVTIYGDGAANNGQVFEAFNIAKLWNLPAFFLCENNLYSMGTSIPRSTANPDFYKKGDVIPGIWANGMDVVSVREAARFAHQHCVSGKGPIILEAETYRYFGHSLSDPGTSYRSHEEIQDVRHNRDPITTFKKKIVDVKLVTEEELKAIDKKAKKLLDEATKKAKSDKPVPLAELTWDVYANDIFKEVRVVSPFQKSPHKVSGRAINLK